MNKNTIIKLIAVLAMCFLIGGALVACKGATGPAGPQGPQGEKGETGAAGSTPKLTIGANGNWFADGVDLGVKAPSADAACAEHDFEYVDVVKHTQTEKGVVVKACKTCGFAAITNETIHVWKDGEIPANCLEAKWVGSFCEICDFKGEGDFVGKPNGHTYGKFQPVFESGKPTCQDGGIVVRHCLAEGCDEIEKKTVTGEEYPCNVIDWQYDTAAAPSEETVGALEGICTICGGVDEYELPVLGSDAYEVVDLKAVTCATKGERQYTLVDADRGVNYVLKVDVKATGHKLNGQDYANYDINDGASYYAMINGVSTLLTSDVIVPYWYGAADTNGRLAPLGVSPFVNTKFECEGTASGWFKCDECAELVSVYVYYEHNGVAKVTKAPSCCAEGTMEVDCDNCDHDSYNKKADGNFANALAPVSLKKIPHTYNYQLVKDTTKTVTVDGQPVDVYVLTGECTGNGCDKCEFTTVVDDKGTPETDDDVTTKIPKVDTYSDANGNPYYIVNPSKEVVEEATCNSFGSTKYTFNYVINFDDPATAEDEQEISSITKNYTVVDGKTHHKLGGKFLSTAELNAIKHNDAGIKIATNLVATVEAAPCETPVDAYFFCEHCGEVVAVQATKAHAESNVSNYESKAPSCTEAGFYYFDCKNEACTTVGEPADGATVGVAKTKIKVVLPVLDHKTTQTFVELTAENTVAGQPYVSFAAQFAAGTVKFVIANICDDCKQVIDDPTDISDDMIGVTSYKLGAKVPSTCYGAGYQMYRVTINGKVEQFKIALPLEKHTVAGLKIDSDEFKARFMKGDFFLAGTPNVGVFANNELACGGTAAGYYDCEVCKAAGRDSLVTGITVHKAHSVDTIVTPATCTAGTIYKCNCSTTVTHQLPAPGHKYEYTVTVDKSTYIATVKGECFCSATFEDTFQLAVPATGDAKEEYYTIELVEAATCTTGAKYTYTTEFKHVEDLTKPVADVDRHTFTQIKLDDDKLIASDTASFDLVGEKNGHNFEKAELLIVKHVEKIVVNSEEKDAEFYYFVLICPECGFYANVDKMDAEEFKAYGEKTEAQLKLALEGYVSYAKTKYNA